MISLGIEGTAHTVGVGVAEDKKILSNVSRTIKPKDGIHPREAANFIAKHIVDVVSNALIQANCKITDIDIISFSQGPGLGPCLRTVATGARAISVMCDIPIIGVNHCIAHLEVGKLVTGCKDPVMLYVSGGNTQVISFSRNRYRVFGETLDIGIGNLFDKFARAVGLGFPGGPKIEQLASHGKKIIPMPYSIKGMDVSFSGILTFIEKLIDEHQLEDICYSLQETCFAMLTEVTERAMAYLNKSELLLAGGVARNKRLQRMLLDMVTARNAKLFVPDSEYCVDNGAMIAYTGLIMYKGGVRMKLEDTGVKQRFRTDDVDVVW